MKKFILLMLTGILLTACADDMLIQNPEIGKAKQAMFSYDSITAPAVWQTYRSYNEMIEACQIPENILKKIPTDTLIALCVNHPLAYNYIFFENPLEGVMSVMNRFNGFNELKNREDGITKLLDFYEKININFEPTKLKRNAYAKTRTEIKPFQVGFIELVLASGTLPELYNSKNIDRLERIANDKYEHKLQDKKYLHTEAISKSLILGARIKIERESSVNSHELQKFIQRGGKINSTRELSEISKIIYSK